MSRQDDDWILFVVVVVVGVFAFFAWKTAKDYGADFWPTVWMIVGSLLGAAGAVGFAWSRSLITKITLAPVVIWPNWWGFLDSIGTNKMAGKGSSLYIADQIEPFFWSEVWVQVSVEAFFVAVFFGVLHYRNRQAIAARQHGARW